MKCGLKGIVMVLAGICLALPLFGRLTITDLHVQQRWPWNGLVDITYRVESTMKNSDGSAAEVTLSFAGYDRDQNQKVAMKTLTGDGVGATVKAGATYTTTWNVAKDYPTFNSSAFKVTVKAVAKARHTPSVKPEPGTTVKAGRYLVIDLSGGPEAQSYPHRYSETGPEMTGNACRTTELWLREIPAGTFMMGSPEAALGHEADEMLHEVTISKPFLLGVFEVTQKQWELVMGSNPSEFKSEDRPVECVSYDMIRGTGKDAGAGWPSAGHQVDLGSFLGRLQSKSKLALDLPTEAQWEYACRAGTTTSLNSGMQLSTLNGKCSYLDVLGRYDDNQHDAHGHVGEHTRVGSYAPNAWGMYDMHGNVSEWCLDWYQSSLGASSLTDPVGGESGSLRTLRGGHWNSFAKDCCSSSRASVVPTYMRNDGGFRLASSSEEGTEPEVSSGTYLVIDLSGGPDAASYPYRYSKTGPDLSSDACRTMELWLRRIPAGTFMMGSPENELGRGFREPLHQVTLTMHFYIGVFEVTQKQWKLVMGDNPSKNIGSDRPVEHVSYEMIRGNSKTAGAGWPRYGHRVDSYSFLGRLQAKTGLVLDLPTEAQWEYACRAGTTTALNNGKNLTVESGKCPNMDEVGRYWDNQKDGRGGYDDLARVGCYAPNAWGLFDMHGNVDEWCLDWAESKFGTEPVVDPVGDDIDYTQSDSAWKRVHRGGSWNSRPSNCRSAYGYYYTPSPGWGTGFRIVCVP